MIEYTLTAKPKEFYATHWDRLVRARAEMATGEKHIYDTLSALREEAQAAGYWPGGSQGTAEDFAFFDLFFDTIAEFLTDCATSDCRLREVLSDLDSRAAAVGWHRTRRHNTRYADGPCNGCGQTLSVVCLSYDCGGQFDRCRGWHGRSLGCVGTHNTRA